MSECKHEDPERISCVGGDPFWMKCDCGEEWTGPLPRWVQTALWLIAYRETEEEMDERKFQAQVTIDAAEILVDCTRKMNEEKYTSWTDALRILVGKEPKADRVLVAMDTITSAMMHLYSSGLRSVLN